MRKKTNSKILIQINQNNQYIVMFVCLITFIPIERVSMYVLHELIVSIDTKMLLLHTKLTYIWCVRVSNYYFSFFFWEGKEWEIPRYYRYYRIFFPARNKCIKRLSLNFWKTGKTFFSHCFSNLIQLMNEWMNEFRFDAKNPKKKNE